MSTLPIAGPLLDEHISVTRRYFLAVGAGGLLSSLSPAHAESSQLRVENPKANPDAPSYLTKDADFGTVERGNPFPYTLPEERKRQIGMTRDTWKLDVVADTATGAKVASPMSAEHGNPFTWRDLMRLSETNAVRYLKVITCNNLNVPLGMGLWEGVPLRDVIWLTKPQSDIRRVFYYGHHNEDSAQMFRSSLSFSRVLEDPPGDYPVILCTKLNGEWLSGKRGGPVRMIIPEAYGFKSVKWIQRVTLTNLHGANDTYAQENNDIDSWMKSMARFVSAPKDLKRGSDLAVSGVAQVGLSGVKSVQVWLHPAGNPLPADDPYFTKAPWKDARILPPPDNWNGGTGWTRLPEGTLGVDPATGKPVSWPMRYAVAHWAAVIPGVGSGSYDLRCRTIDSRGIAQPMPRPIGRSGLNSIDKVEVRVV